MKFLLMMTMPYKFAQSLWLEVGGTTNKDEGLFSFIEYPNLIRSKAKGFTYKIAEFTSNSYISGNGKKLLGVIWQTATMRRNFELFGDLIGLDIMKQGINTLLWPYFSVAMYDKMSKICIACEGVLCGEREDMFKFACDFLGAASPKWPLSEVKVVAEDGFFDQDLVRKLGFTNAFYVTDQWHLLDSGIEIFLAGPVMNCSEVIWSILSKQSLNLNLIRQSNPPCVNCRIKSHTMEILKLN